MLSGKDDYYRPEFSIKFTKHNQKDQRIRKKNIKIGRLHYISKVHNKKNPNN